jgi:S4 domain protein YaaA
LRTKQKPRNQTITVQGDHITLGQLLKTANIIGSGGEAKFYLANNTLTVNREAENRRGRKLRPGDVVACPQSTITLIEEDPNAPPPKETE